MDDFEMTPEQEHLVAEIEYAYTNGNSFSIGEDDLVRWLMATGWKIEPPPGFEAAPVLQRADRRFVVRSYGWNR